MKFNSRSTLYGAANRMLAGLVRHVVGLNIVHVTVVALTQGLKAARASETAYQSNRSGKRAAVAAQNTTRSVVEDWCVRARDVLRPYLGNSWSEVWAEAGFKNNTLSLPTALPDLIELVRSLQEYFKTHSGRENASLYVTATVAGQHFDALDAAVTAVKDCKREQRASRETRDKAEATLIKLMRKLHSELEAVLEPDDVRWLDFEAEAPADESVPEAVVDVEVDADGPGTADVEWPPSLRASRYHVEVLEVGQDTEFRRIATVRDPNVTLDTLTPAVRTKVRVVAVNGAGESAPSAAVEVTTPAALQSRAA